MVVSFFIFLSIFFLIGKIGLRFVGHALQCLKTLKADRESKVTFLLFFWLLLYCIFFSSFIKAILCASLAMKLCQSFEACFPYSDSTTNFWFLHDGVWLRSSYFSSPQWKLKTKTKTPLENPKTWWSSSKVCHSERCKVWNTKPFALLFHFL